jgi:ribonuclease P protein component
MVLFVLRMPRNDVRRVGFTAQRAVGSAVRRNRIRRRLKALYHFYEDSILVSADLIFLGKKSMIDAPWDELQQSMKRVLRKAGCLQE